jgi:hypothetical protein
MWTGPGRDDGRTVVYDVSRFPDRERLNGPGELLTRLLPLSHMTSVLSTGEQWTPISSSHDL